MNTGRRLSFSFPELRYSLFRIQQQHKLPTFDELDEMFGAVRLLFFGDVFVALAFVIA